MEGRELPVGWVEVPIGDLCELRNGRAFKPAEWSDEGIPIVRIQNLNNRQAKFNHYQGEVDANHLLGGGELLFAWSGTPGTSFGAHIWAGGKAALNQHIFRVDFDEVSLKKDFFRYAINQKLNDLIDIAHGGVGLRHVTKGKFEQTEVCLPPLNEQRRIAAKLDTTLAAVDACRQRLDGVATILKRFRQAVLAAATSGELTQEWREEAGTVFDWPKVILCDHAEGFSYGTSAKSHSEGEIPVLRMGNIQNGGLDWTSLAFTSDLSEIAKYMLDPGDVLFNRTNSPELVGKTAIYRGEQPAIYAGYLIRVRCRASLDPEFLNVSLNSLAAREYCWRVKSDGVSQSNINAKKLAAYSFMLPLIDEQVEIVRRTHELFSYADQLEAKLTAARKVVDRLTPALLAKAFCGELVPQDPSDEPASVLLERIRAARQAEAAAGKPSRRGRKKAVPHPDQLPLDAAPVAPNLLSGLLQECGALSERALLAASELDPERFRQQFEVEHSNGAIRETSEDGQVLLEANQ
ncbi:MAG: restriction endonuclease subunit S [Cyanobacteria bacterium]|nr:restriction endonuclease subunit S [Cyanobacteriota bacterium]